MPYSSACFLSKFQHKNNAITCFDGTTCKLIQNSTVILSDAGNITVTGKTVNYPIIAGSIIRITFAKAIGISMCVTKTDESSITIKRLRP